jgi:hypothetical protein
LKLLSFSPFHLRERDEEVMQLIIKLIVNGGNPNSLRVNLRKF